MGSSSLEENKSEPLSLREILKKMREVSELMIDIAYSAILFQDKDLAEELLDLEKYIDHLTYKLWEVSAIAIRDPEEAEKMAAIIKVGSVVDEISNALADVVPIIERGLELHPLIGSVLEKVRHKHGRARIFKDSILVGWKLGSLKLEIKLGLDIIAIKRMDEWIIKPSDEEILRVNDCVIVEGSEIGISKFIDLAEGRLKEVPKSEYGES
jgi:uncharacterized protein with PhoU and TrkA domain